MERAVSQSEDFDRRLAARLALLREERGWTLDQLAAASGLSKANLSRLEKGQVSPTANTLARLCTAYGLTMSRLLALAEQRDEGVLARKDQPVWKDPSGGFLRRSVSTAGPGFECDVIECELAPDKVVIYDTPTRVGLEHHICFLEGGLDLMVDGAKHRLRPGDSLKYRLHGSSEFRASAKGARYLLVIR